MSNNAKEALVDLVNNLANQPANLEAGARGYGSVDLSSFVENPESIVIGNKKGVSLFAHIPDTDGVFEGHYLFDKDTRGEEALDMAREMLKLAFTKHGVKVIVGQTPVDNKAARAFTRALGFTPVGDSVDSLSRPCVVYRMERKQWEVSSVE